MHIMSYFKVVFFLFNVTYYLIRCILKHIIKKIINVKFGQ